MQKIPTVMINRDGQNVIINASDYDAERDGEVIGDPVAPAAEPAAFSDGTAGGSVVDLRGALKGSATPVGCIAG